LSCLDRRALIATALLGVAMHVHAGEPFDLRVGIDMRAVAANTNDSFVDGGYGRTRFDEDHQGLRFGSAYLAARYRLADSLSLHGDLVAYGDGHGAAVDVTELYLQFRPFPVGPIRWSARAGAFYPEFSMENRGPAWTPVYTLTPSAINTWYGEELRAIGVEGEMRWLGASQGYQGDVALIAGMYGWNDPIGVVIADRGWALHDRQTGLNGYLSATNAPGNHIHEFREIDKQPGYYAGLDWRHGDRLSLRVYRYDNRADPAAVARNYAWLTRFDAVGLRFEPNANWTVLAQTLKGATYVGPQDTWGQIWDMKAWYVMLSREWRQWRVSLRRDGFSTEQTKGLGRLGEFDDRGHAWTVAATWEWREQWQLLAEWLQIDSRFPERQSVGEAADQRERQLQLALRYQWHY
jgi:hypothetical protein